MVTLAFIILNIKPKTLTLFNVRFWMRTSVILFYFVLNYFRTLFILEPHIINLCPKLSKKLSLWFYYFRLERKQNKNIVAKELNDLTEKNSVALATR